MSRVPGPVPFKHSPDASALVTALLAGERHALARVISRVENRHSDLAQLVAALYPHAGRARIWGITGPPGAGKSTLVDQMVRDLRQRGQRVAVVAVDPSSPFSGGAILGDRIRMQEHANDDGVFIRSLGTRGTHGGLSLATKEVVMVLDAAGFDTILVETAGVGQTELGVLKVAQSILVVLVPESGDSIQVMKAGLMEIAHCFAVNKADRPEADKLVKELVTLISQEGVEMFGGKRPDPAATGAWFTPILKTEAVRGVGVSDLVEKLLAHSDFLRKTGTGAERERASVLDEVTEILVERLRARTAERWWDPAQRERVEALLKREIDPYHFAEGWENSSG